jgi:hypothetical protein
MKILDALMADRSLLESLSADQLRLLLALVQEEKQRSKGWASQMAETIPTSLIQDVLQDTRRAGQAQAGMVRDEGRPSNYGVVKGWQEPVPLAGSVKGIKLVDELCDAQDILDKRALAKRLGGG